MKIASLLLAAALLTASCGPKVKPATSPASPSKTSPASAARTSPADDAAVAAGDTLAFAWPVPSVLRVRERADKGKGAATMQYELHVSRAPGGEDVLVDFRNFEFLELNDQPITAAQQVQLARVSALTGAIPTLRIAPDGTPTAEDIDGVVEEVIRFLAEEQNMSGEQVEATRAFFNDPKTRAKHAASSLDFWHRWVSLWVGIDTAPSTYERDLESPLPGGSPLPSAITIVNEGPTDGGLRLTASWELTDREARTALKELMQVLIDAIELESDDAFDLDKALQSARASSKVEAIVDPATLVPRTLSSVETFEITLDGETERRSETHDYQFERID